MTTGKYELVIKWASGQSTICGEMTDHQHGEICRILSPDYRAHPSQQGEAVEVVATLEIGDYSDDESIYARITPGKEFTIDDVCEDDALIRLSQHQRILAAATHPADQVAEGVVVSRELLERLADKCAFLHDTRKAQEELRALLEPKP